MVPDNEKPRAAGGTLFAFLLTQAIHFPGGFDALENHLFFRGLTEKRPMMGAKVRHNRDKRR
jgi:hypothetical protein